MNHKIKTLEMPTPGKLQVNGKIITFDMNGVIGVPKGDLSPSELYDVVLHLGVEFRVDQHQTDLERDQKYCAEM